MKRLLILLVVAFCLAIFPAEANAYHRFQTGKHIVGLQYLLQGHGATKIKAYRGKRTGVYDKKTTNAVRNTKWRLGWPEKGLHGRVAGSLFVGVLKGTRKRPIGYIGVASARLKKTEQAKASSCSRKEVLIANSQIGVHEYPWGSNLGLQVRVYQSVTGAYGAAWCVSFAQWVLRQTGVGPIANGSAGVFYTVEWAHRRGWLHAQPRVGSLVGFLYYAGHMGVVTQVTPGGFYSVEGNHNNSVARVYHPLGYHHSVFIWLPNCT